MDMLTSPDNPAVRRLRLLAQDAAERRREGRAVAEGPHLAREALASGLARRLWATEAALDTTEGKAILAQAHAKGLAPRLLGEPLFARLSDTPAPQGWLVEVDTAAPAPLPSDTLLLALDAVQDPGNLGTLLRSAWAAGASMILGKGCADAWSPKVLRAGAGAQFHLRLALAEELSAALRELAGRGVRVYGTGPRAKAGYLEADCRQAHCWVLGSEGRGLSPEAEAACGGLYRISYPGSAESLNAAVSGAVLLFEALRQRSLKMP